MTTLTDEQARKFAKRLMRNYATHTMEYLVGEYILSRPSSGVQPIAGDLGNAGQSEGAAHAAPTPGEKP